MNKLPQPQLLTNAQAQNIYDAMCYLNNIGMKLSARMPGLVVWEDVDGSIWVQVPHMSPEFFKDQNSFAEFYGIVL